MTLGHIAPPPGADGQQPVFSAVLGKRYGLVPFGAFILFVRIGIKKREHVRQPDFRTENVARLGAAHNQQIRGQFLFVDLAVAVGVAATQHLVEFWQPHAVLRLAARPTRRHEQSPVADGGRAGGRRKQADPPLFGAVGQSQRRHAHRAVEDYFCGSCVIPNHGRGIARQVRQALVPPGNPSRAAVDGQQHRFRRGLDTEHDEFVGDDRRTPGTIGRRRGRLRQSPHFLAGEIIANQAIGTEIAVNPLSVRRWRGVGRRADGMDLLGCCSRRGLPPQDFAIGPRQAQRLQVLRFAIESREEDAVAPDAGRGMARRQRRHPNRIVRPKFDRQGTFVRCHATGVWSAELGPTSRRLARLSPLAKPTMPLTNSVAAEHRTRITRAFDGSFVRVPGKPPRAYTPRRRHVRKHWPSR